MEKQMWLRMEEEEEEDVVAAVEKALQDWSHNFSEASRHIELIQSCGVASDANNLPRLNASVQDCLSAMRSAQFRLDLLAEQQPTHHQIESCQHTLQVWKEQYQSLQLKLRNANFKAKANIQKAAQQERELLLGGGEESTIRRRNLETKTGMTGAAESITQSLRRARQMMVQEVERGSSTLATLDQSTGTLRKAESEYKGHRSLLINTRHLLTVMRRQDILERIIMAVGFLFFCTVVLYIFTKRIGLLKLQRKLSASMRRDGTEINTVSEDAHHANNLYAVKDGRKVDIDAPERKVVMGGISSPDKSDLDNNIQLATHSSPVCMDVRLDIKDDETNSHHPSFLSNNQREQIHEEF